MDIDVNSTIPPNKGDDDGDEEENIDTSSTFVESEISTLEAAAKREREELNELHNRVLDMATIMETYDLLYANLPASLATEISRSERTQKKYRATSLSYSEVSFEEFYKQFEKLKHYGFDLNSGGYFYDIGCGTGKLVVAAALLHDFHSCVGIEILTGLHDICEEVIDSPLFWDTHASGFPRVNSTTFLFLSMYMLISISLLSLYHYIIMYE